MEVSNMLTLIVETLTPLLCPVIMGDADLQLN